MASMELMDTTGLRLRINVIGRNLLFQRYDISLRFLIDSFSYIGMLLAARNEIWPYTRTTSGNVDVCACPPQSVLFRPHSRYVGRGTSGKSLMNFLLTWRDPAMDCYSHHVYLWGACKICATCGHTAFTWPGSCSKIVCVEKKYIEPGQCK